MRRNILIAILVILIGIGIFSYGQYRNRVVYQSEEKEVGVWPFKGTVEKNKSIPLPVVVGGVVIIVGFIFLFMRPKNR